MRPPRGRFPLALFLLACGWLAGPASVAHADMYATVTSLADDADAYPWDDPDTADIDESMDGTCEDQAHRQTLRAALLEAGNMGVPCHVTFAVSGDITLNEGTLYPTDFSVLQGNSQVRLLGSGMALVMLGIDNYTTVRGLRFAQGSFAVVVTGTGNTIAGNTFTDNVDGLDVFGNGNTIGGSSAADRNVFTGMTQNAVLLGGDDNVVKGNFIGLDAQGASAGNATGVFVTGAGNVIGGTAAADRNIISGNHVAGVSVATITGVGSATIIGNYIGTDPTGLLKRPNEYGIQVVTGSARIGGDSPGEMNVISGNTSAGVETRGDNLAVTIVGNNIGVDASGTVPLGNRDGVNLSPGSFDCMVRNNRIEHNELSGIFVFGLPGMPSINHRIRGNRLNWNGNTGVQLSGDATDVVIGSSLTQDFEPNEIRFNGLAGVSIEEMSGGTPRANTIRKNDFLENTMWGIVLGAPPVNDGIQPPTVQTYAYVGNGNSTVSVVHDRVGALIDVYAAEKGSAQAYQGRRWLGSASVVGSGVPLSIPVAACNCTHVVATATDLAENTSEFGVLALPLAGAARCLHAGWNMVSVPLIVGNSQAGALFPTAPGGAQSYAGGSYTAQGTLQHGLGYWVNSNRDTCDVLPGALLTSDTVAVAAGWNLIGSISVPVPVSRIASVPPGMITGRFFGFTTTYGVADTLQPGKAYWVKTPGSGALVLTAAQTPPPSGLIQVVPDGTLPPPPPGAAAGVSDPSQPAAFVLGDAYPNPFDRSTTIGYSLARRTYVRLQVVDVLGREVATIVDGVEEPGVKAVTWRVSNMPSGVYFCRLQAGGFLATRKVLLLK